MEVTRLMVDRALNALPKEQYRGKPRWRWWGAQRTVEAILRAALEREDDRL